MEMIKKIITNEVFWNFVTLISSFIIVKITMGSEEKRNKENMKFQIEQTKIELETQKEQVRATLLPFLKLQQEIRIGKRKENLVFPLTLKNCGNSGAFDVRVEHFSSNDQVIYVCKEEIGSEIDYYQYTGFLFDNTLPVGQSADFEVLLDICINGKHYQKRDFNTGKIHFNILFKDSMYNQYKQEYMVQFTESMGVGRVESYLPQLIEK